ncbi:MAG: ABC transporter substrate-binding protein [Planctomycetes bacterium]|nr:ABC transporter substrate-binding protein [Planctomycetota bacterium]
MKFSIMLLVAMLVCLSPICANQNAEGMETFLQGNIEKIVEIITNAEASSDEKKSQVSKVFSEAFDLPRLAAMSLGGSSWRKLSLEEKKKFTGKFSEFVLSFYVNKLDQYNNNQITYGKGKMRSKTKGVMPVDVEFQGKVARMNYSMVYSKDVWKIFDVEVEGIRLSTTYRSQFQSLYQKKGFDGIISALDDLIKKQE